MSAIYALAIGFLMLLGMVFIEGRIGMITFISLELSGRKTIFLAHSMAGGGIPTERQSKHYEDQKEFHSKYLSSRTK